MGDAGPIVYNGFSSYLLSDCDFCSDSTIKMFFLLIEELISHFLQEWLGTEVLAPKIILLGVIAHIAT